MVVAVVVDHYEKYGKKYYEANQEKERRRNKAYYNMNRERVLKRTTQRTLKYRYNLTEDQFLSMVKEQDNKCFLCGKEPRQGRNLDIDHDHNTGRVRKLLCNNCNRGIGHLKDNPKLLRDAAQYIENYTVNSPDTGAVAEFESVKTAKKIAESQLEYYQKMMNCPYKMGTEKEYESKYGSDWVDDGV